MRKIIILAFLTLTCTYSYGFMNVNDAGVSSGQFLKMGSDAKSSAMGEAVVASVSNSTAIYWNPAGLNKVNSMQVSLMHSFYTADIFYDYLSVANKIPGFGSIALGVQYVNYGAMSETDATGTVLSSFTPVDMAIALGYACQMSGFDLGISVKYISSTITVSASAIAFDAGIQVPMGQSLILGAAVKNIGLGGLTYVSQSGTLPLGVFVGGAYSITKDLIVEADAVIPSDNSLGFNAGAEYKLALGGDMFISPRAGYNSLSSGLAFGAGFAYGKYVLDYSLTLSGDMGQISRFSLGVNF